MVPRCTVLLQKCYCPFFCASKGPSLTPAITGKYSELIWHAPCWPQICARFLERTKRWCILIAMLRDVLYGFLSIYIWPHHHALFFSTPSWTSCIFFALLKVIYQRHPKTKAVVSSHFRVGKPCFGRCHEGGLNLHPAFSCTEYLSLAIYIEFVPGWQLTQDFMWCCFPINIYDSNYFFFEVLKVCCDITLVSLNIQT